MSLRSMTGYARLRQARDESPMAGELTVAIKSVNHRGLDLHFHMSSFFDPFEGAMRTLVKQNANRGHIDVRINFARQEGASTLQVNQELLTAYKGLFRQYPDMGQPDLNAALGLPGIMMESREEEVPTEFQVLLLATLESALRDWNVQRAREGTSLGEQMTLYNASIRTKAIQVRSLRGHILPVLKARIQEKITELLSGSNLDPGRLAQEAAYLADRGDIEEEITRLLTHCQHLETLLVGNGETGKKLDFLLQEMNREANTILSKSNNSGDYGLQITELGLGMKTEIERIREQSLNLE